MDDSTCGADDCDRPHLSRGFCKRHYQIWYRANRDQTSPHKGHRCATEGCDGDAGWATGICKRCRMRKFDEGRAEENRARAQARYARLRASELEKARIYRELHPDRVRDANLRYRTANPERVREATRRYRESPRGMVKNRQKSTRRRALLRDAFVEQVDYAAVLAEHGMFCHICWLVIVDESDLHFDHVIPLALGGKHERTNIRPSHALCNLRKGARPL